MKKLLLMPLLCFSCSVSAQIIKGRLFGLDKHALEFVTVSLNVDSGQAILQISDKQGQFQFNGVKLKTHCKLTFSLVGYKTADTAFFYTNNSNVDKILIEDSKVLKEVKVNGRRNVLERKVDRLIFNVENNVITAGADGMDLLGKTPLVKVDGDAIKMVGKEDLAVMINGRLTHLSGQALTNMLRTINAENISRIEVITNPPAQYDAQGNSGIVNIIIKKNKTPGYSGVISERLNFDTYKTSAPNLSMNYNLDKLMLFGGIGFARGANGPTSNQTRYYDEQTWSRYDRVKEQSRYLVANLGFEYPLSKNTTIGASYNSSASKPNMSGSSRTFVVNNSTRQIDSILNVGFINTKQFDGKAANIHLSQKLDSLGETFDFDADYFYNRSDINNVNINYNTFAGGEATQNPVNTVQSDDDLKSHGYTFNGELNLQRKKYSFTLGAKSSFVSSTSNVMFSQSSPVALDAGQVTGNVFEYQENIQAVFASFKADLGKWQFQGGVRAEATQTKGFSQALDQTNKNNYVSVFPTIYLTREIGKEDVISFNFGRRISRPFFSSFNPFRVYQNQYDYSTGNPFLKPSFTYNFELTNTFHNILSTTLSYGISRGLETSVLLIANDSNAVESTIGNFLSSKDLLLDNSISAELFGFLESTDEVSLYYSSNRSTSSILKSYTSGFGADFRTANRLPLDKEKVFTAGIDFTYAFPNNTSINRLRQYYYADVSLTGSLFHKTLQLTLSGRDIFKTKNVSIYSVYNNIGYRSGANNDSRRLVINLKYSFGNKKLRRGQSHSSSSPEQGRAGH